jgi:hypothetical protein
MFAVCAVVLTQIEIVSLSLFASDDILVLAATSKEHSQNVIAADNNWDNLCVVQGRNGSITWKFDVKKEAEYYIQAIYASNERRPCTLKIYPAQNNNNSNEIIAANVAGEITGGFKAPDLKWKQLHKTTLTKGEWKLNISSAHLLPHFRGFRITTDSNLPVKDILADELQRFKAAEAEKENQLVSATRQKIKQLMPDVSEIVFVRRATFQSSHYYTDFIDGSRVFGSELCVLSLADGSVRSLVPSLKDGIIDRCNLSFDGKKIIFDYKAKVGEGYRIWEVNTDGTGLRQLTFPPADEQSRIEKYWIRTRGGGEYRHHTDDMHPAYLPDGGFVFISTRCEYGILCDGPDYLTVTVLYRADKDGKQIEKLSNNALSETCPTVMEDGRILYTRWEYVDNGSVTNKGLWALNPDGTASTEVYGANIAYPSVFNAGRQIPDQPNKFVCIGAPHMPVGVGTVLLVDTSYDRRTVDGVKYITPEVDQQFQARWQKPPQGQKFSKLYVPPAVTSKTIQNDRSRDGGGNTDRGPLFMDPYPINEYNYIVSYNPSERYNSLNAYALYLINDKGERDLLYRPEKYSAWCAIPIRATKIPPNLTVAKDADLASKNLAQLVVLDIYAGMENVPRGSIKFIRINEHVPRPWSARRFWDGDEYDQQHSVVTMRTHLGLKAQYGIVKVESDGSANFVVPADKNIFLQALDENYREVQRERTFINLRPGEVRSCVGCHERATESPIAGGRTTAIALRRTPEVAGAQPGEKSGARPISYFEDVQPVLDKHCVKCHSNEKPEGKINLASDLTPLFNRSYETLMNWNSFPVIRENYPKAGNNHVLPPYSLGSHASRLVKLIDKGHYEVKMPIEDWVRLTTWVDSNGQYYGTYFGRKNIKYKNLPDFRPTPTFKEIETSIPPAEIKIRNSKLNVQNPK